MNTTGVGDVSPAGWPSGVMVCRASVRLSAGVVQLRVRTYVTALAAASFRWPVDTDTLAAERIAMAGHAVMRSWLW